MLLYVEFIRMNKAEVKSNFDPVSITGIVSKTYSGTIIESGLSATKDQSVYTDGHYYIDLDSTQSQYDDQLCYIEFNVVYQTGFTAKTLRKYFRVQSVEGAKVVLPIGLKIDANDLTVKVTV